jgi:integrase
MPSNLLTATECKNATCAKVAVRKLHDGDGLYLWIFADGKKYWRMRYWQSGKEKSLSLGVYPKVGLKDARAKRDAMHQQLQAGLDPSTERKAANHRKQVADANSFEAVALEWYDKQRHTWVSHHATDVDRRLRGNIFPVLGGRPIGGIEAPELLMAIRKIESRGSYDLAHRVLQVCGQVFRYGIATGRCSRNLSADLRGALAPHVKKHQAAVRPEELPALLRAIASYDTLGDKQTRLALQLLALTFVRTNELIGAVWTEFNLDEKVWVIPAERMKMRAEHIVPLSAQTIVLLAELKSLAGTSHYLLPGRNCAKPISNNTMLFALYRLGYKGRMTGHGFRAVASTVLNEQGFRPDVIERQLAHCERNAVRGAYNRAEYLVERKRMLQWWADYVDSIVDEPNVIVGKFGGGLA